MLWPHNVTASRPTVDGRCVAASVVAKDAGKVADLLGRGWDPGRDGTPPQVWVPDSSLWLAVAATRPAAAVLPRGRSIASSPIVMALRQPMARALGWPQHSLTWTEVIGAFAQPGIWAKAGHPEWAALRVGVTDPSGSTAGLGSVLAILDPDATGSVGNAQLVGGLGFTRVLGAVAADSSTFFAAQGASVGDPNSAVAAFPALERDIAAYNSTRPTVPLVPVYDAKHPIVADYPYTVLSGRWVSTTDRAAANEFLEYLLTPAAQQRLGALGLRAPNGAVARAEVLPTDLGFQATLAAPRAVPDPAALSVIITEWANLQRQVNLLAVLDTSGSMRLPVPGTALTRMQLLQQTAIAGFGLLTNRTSIGLWEFSVRAGSASEYREVVPFGPLLANVGAMPRGHALAAAVAQLRPAGFTPLYDSVYAAVHHMQEHWQSNSTNAVLLITDGANELNGGLSLADLVSRLTRERRADQPVQVVGIAVGPQADAASLQRIAEATDGRTFVVRDPAAAIQTLILAFTGRLQ
jgi:Ca-activated chloride channel family protein